MKKTAKILALVLLVVTTMVSCTKNNSASNGNQNANLIVGKWKCVSYSDDYEYISWAKSGDFWNFSSDGTLNFDAYSTGDETVDVHYVSAHYIHSEKWITFFSSVLGEFFSAETVPTMSFEITEISRDKLVLDFSHPRYEEYIHIEFEKED